MQSKLFYSFTISQYVYPESYSHETTIEINNINDFCRQMRMILSDYHNHRLIHTVPKTTLVIQSVV